MFMKAKACTLIFNTRWGYCLTPMQFPSISKALEHARASEMAYRILIDGHIVRTGWFCQ